MKSPVTNPRDPRLLSTALHLVLPAHPTGVAVELTGGLLQELAPRFGQRGGEGALSKAVLPFEQATIQFGGQPGKPGKPGALVPAVPDPAQVTGKK